MKHEENLQIGLTVVYTNVIEREEKYRWKNYNLIQKRINRFMSVQTSLSSCCVVRSGVMKIMWERNRNQTFKLENPECNNFTKILFSFEFRRHS